MSAIDDEFDEHQRRYKAPYTAQNPIPTVQHYREEKKKQKRAGSIESTSEEATRYGAENRNVAPASDGLNASPGAEATTNDSATEEVGENTKKDDDEDETVQDTSEALDATKDPKQKRKEMKKRSGDRAEREVTDPVTHLPVKIHDFTGKDLKRETVENEDFDDGIIRRDTGFKETEEQLQTDAALGQKAHRGMERLFPPPDFEATQENINAVNEKSISIALVAMTGLFILNNVIKYYLDGRRHDDNENHNTSWVQTIFGMTMPILLAGISWGILQYNKKKVKDAWESQVWESERRQGHALSKEETPESTHWLNSLFASVWPLVNPDLFISLSDTLEDVMQASLPRLVRMVSVEDIGQGSEALRILGIRWLPKGAATHTVTSDGKISKSRDKDPKTSDRSVSNGSTDTKQDPSSNDDDNVDQNMSEGLEAEEGDFINLEVAFAYKARSASHGMKDRSKNPHLYLAFYLIANVKFPVWVELRGLIGTMRLRLQLTPDPPFFGLCTLTFLGQPKVDLSCVPLVKKGLNIMDLPLISNFVQSAVDAAMAEYVAPKSLTLDLKDMLIGDDFKKDTVAHGVIVVTIKRGYDFKEGDAGITFIRDGSTDGYVTVGWAKFGKPVWSTRVIESDMQPHWEETAFVLVNPDELNVRERLRVQLWDSDRATADDDLGRIEVDIKEIMTGAESRGKMFDRSDGFRSLKAGESMPGKLEWSVGYFPKTKALDEQLAAQSKDPEVQTVEDLKKKVEAESERKLREAGQNEQSEIEQQKAQDFKGRQDELIVNSPPPRQYPSGILSIVVHQITGIELEAINKKQASKHETESDTQEEGDDLPSSYCTIVLNHQKIYRTRTKPKNGKPFFNAGCERFIQDINSAQVHVAVRDARVHEDDPLIGVVFLPLKELFSKRSQINEFFPLAGGIGYGKVRISLVFRSVEMQLPSRMLGWEYGTLDIDSEITGKVSDDLASCKLKVSTSIGSGKYQAEKSGSTWKSKRGGKVYIPVKKRYSSSLTVLFKSSSSFGDSTSAFAILWLKDIPDDEDQEITIPVWKGDLKRAQSNVLEEYGEKVGEIKLKLRFWNGLSGFHVKLAKGDSNVEDVMEILDCTNDVDDNQTIGGYADSSSSSDSDSSSRPPDVEIKERKSRFTEEQDDLQDDGKRGLLSQMDDYKKHSKQLHRKNRGLMQWKAPRTVKWLQHKLDHGEQRVASIFQHHQRDSGVETEA